MSHVSLVLAVLAAAGAMSPTVDDERDPPPGEVALVVPQSVTDTEGVLLQALPSQEELEALLLQVLPPPPEKVVRKTHYYGTVTMDHRAHLARRASCRKCHGPGPVTKLEFTPKVAHERCVACHRDKKQGPVACGGCHVKPTDDAQQLATAAAAEKPPEPAAPGSLVPNPDNVAAALAALDRAEKDRADRERLWQTIELGCAVGPGYGPAVRVSARHGQILFGYAVDVLTGGHEARTTSTLGAGISVPFRRGVALEASAIGGFDAVARPFVAFLPAVGGRAGVQLRRPWRVVRTMNVGVTGLYDLTRERSPTDRVGGLNVYATVSLGLWP